MENTITLGRGDYRMMRVSAECKNLHLHASKEVCIK
jgi:hypothetical protein